MVWILADSSDLKRKPRTSILEAAVWYASAISIAEIEIKHSLGKLEIPADFVDKIKKSGIESLPFKTEEAQILGTLPYHHKDPFDRMIISQAIANNLTVLTDDKTFKLYNVPVLLNKNI